MNRLTDSNGQVIDTIPTANGPAYLSPPKMSKVTEGLSAVKEKAIAINWAHVLGSAIAFSSMILVAVFIWWVIVQLLNSIF